MKINGKVRLLGVCFLMATMKAPLLFSQNLFLELNLNNQALQNMIRPGSSKPSLELFRVIERAGRDDRINGIILNISAYNAGQEILWELRGSLEKFKSRGKKVCAFISTADMDMYCLATVADKIVMDEQGVLMLLGYVWGRGYVQHSLEKLGIGVRELRYMEYKSANEMFTRDSLSDADRGQYGEVLDDIFTLTRDTVTKARSWTENEFNTILNDEFMFSAKNALARGLVDRTGRKEAVFEVIKDINGSEEADGFFLYGDSVTSLTGSMSFYGPGKFRLRNLLRKPPVIAVVYASGVTDMERGIGAWNLARTIEELSEKKRVKAIVVRISSPGGSAEAADLVAVAIKNAKERIPVVVSMGDAAASGGYWASIYASHITASPVTLTGSIGVIGSWFYDKGLNSKLGLTVDTMQRGDHADLLAGIILPHRDLNPAEEARYREYILEMYSGFTARVAAGRGMDIEQVESIAQGRVYSGYGALNAGLIDSIGGLDDAVRIARNLAKIPEDRRVAYQEFPKPKFFDKLLEKLPFTKIFGRRAEAALVTDLFLRGRMPEELRYRIAHNGKVMPILPLESTLPQKNW